MRVCGQICRHGRRVAFVRKNDQWVRPARDAGRRTADEGVEARTEKNGIQGLAARRLGDHDLWGRPSIVRGQGQGGAKAELVQHVHHGVQGEFLDLAICKLGYAGLGYVQLGCSVMLLEAHFFDAVSDEDGQVHFQGHLAGGICVVGGVERAFVELKRHGLASVEISKICDKA